MDVGPVRDSVTAPGPEPKPVPSAALLPDEMYEPPTGSALPGQAGLCGPQNPECREASLPLQHLQIKVYMPASPGNP